MVARVTVKLSGGAPESLAVEVEGVPRVTLPEVKAKGLLTLNGVTVALGANATLELRAEGKEAVVEAEGFAGWAAKVPRHHAAGFRVDGQRKILDLSTPATNEQPVTLRFADGAKAEVGPDSMTRFDLFKDGSYYLSGVGHVYAINADGKSLNLAPYAPPLFGGPLVKTVDALGTARLERRLPQTGVIITGDLLREVVLRADQQQIQLVGNESILVDFPNGARVEVSLQSRTHTLRWHIEKGCIGFSVVGLGCWQARGLSGQTAGVQWDGGAQIMDLWNYTDPQTVAPNRLVLVDLSRGLFGSVAPKAVFQYVQGPDCSSFSTSAAGAPVTLYNQRTQQTIPLDLGNVALSGGEVISGEGGAGGAQPGGERKRTVVLQGQSGSLIAFSGALGNASLSPNSERVLRGRDFGEMAINYSQQGQITLRADAGSYVIQPTALPNWTIELHEGEAITINLDTQRGLFTARSSAGDNTAIKINTPEGFSPTLGPQAAVNFILGDQTIFSGSSGTVAFFEGGGATSSQTVAIAPPLLPRPTGLGTPPVLGAPTIQVEANRIVQESLSNFKP